jgi:hypothetical protein
MKKQKELTKYAPLDLQACCAERFKKLRRDRTSNIERELVKSRSRLHRARTRLGLAWSSAVGASRKDQSGQEYLELANNQVIRSDRYKERGIRVRQVRGEAHTEVRKGRRLRVFRNPVLCRVAQQHLDRKAGARTAT